MPAAAARARPLRLRRPLRPPLRLPPLRLTPPLPPPLRRRPRLTLLLQQTGRVLISLCLGAGLPEALCFYTTDVLSMLFTLVILWIVKRLDGVLENQTCYLARIGRESRETDEGGFR